MYEDWGVLSDDVNKICTNNIVLISFFLFFAYMLVTYPIVLEFDP